jgi:hypothetical protein
VAKTIIGLEAKLYRNIATWATPTWVEIENVKDLSLGIEKSEAEASNRVSEWQTVRGALKSGTVEFNMIYDPSDADWTAIKDAFLNNTAIDCAVMDGDITVADNEGLRAEFEVLKWSHTQNLEEVLMTEVSLKPRRTDNAPEWMVVV